MRRIHSYDIFRESEYSITELVLGHYCSKIAHCFTVFLCIGDCGEGVGPAVVLWEGDYVGPCWVVGVFAHTFEGELSPCRCYGVEEE